MTQCPKCNGSVTTDKEHVSEGYAFACLSCDEDFCNIEVKSESLNMTEAQERLRLNMFATIPPTAWEHLQRTPQNINWMYSVYAIEESSEEDGVEFLQSLLHAMNTHYIGPISIHEGWGGCEADSNLELITTKLQFDLRENYESINPGLYRAAIELGWLDSDVLEQSLA